MCGVTISPTELTGHVHVTVSPDTMAVLQEANFPTLPPVSLPMDSEVIGAEEVEAETANIVGVE